MPSAFDYREMASEHLKEAATTKDAARKKRIVAQEDNDGWPFPGFTSRGKLVRMAELARRTRDTGRRRVVPEVLLGPAFRERRRSWRSYWLRVGPEVPLHLSTTLTLGARPANLSGPGGPASPLRSSRTSLSVAAGGTDFTLGTA